MKRLIIFIILLKAIFSNTNYILKTNLQEVPPKFIMSSDGKISGISYEIMKKIEQNSIYKFNYLKELVPINRVIYNLKNGDTDIQFGLQKTAEREKYLVYGSELYKIKIVGLIKKSSQIDIKSIEDLKNKNIVILTQYGTAVDTALKKINGLKIDSNAKSLENNMNKLFADRGQIIIYHDLSIYYFLSKPQYRDKFKVIEIDFKGNKELSEVAQYVVFSKKVSLKVIKDINTNIETIKKNGELKKIVNRYNLKF